MSDWYSLLRPQYVFSILGVVSFFAAVVSTFTGKTRIRFGDWVYRAKEPSGFWRIVAIYYFFAVCSILIVLGEVYRH
jgi:hypothetical protein